MDLLVKPAIDADESPPESKGWDGSLGHLLSFLGLEERKYNVRECGAW
jgi:hypothetical protein